MKKVVNKMENSELLAHFLMSRDNLISIKRALLDNAKDEDLYSLFDLEEKRYNEYLMEVYRRMQYARRTKR